MQQDRKPWQGMVWRFAFGAALFVLAMVLIVTFVPLGGAAGGGLKLQAAKLESSNNAAMSSSAMRSTDARLQIARVGVVNLSEHPLMHRIAPQVVERLQGTRGLEQVVQLESGDAWVTEGQRLFDVMILLDMPRHEESGMGLTGRELKATVTAEVGPQPWDPSYGYNDHLSPPIINFHAHLRLEHTSTTTGYESADARGSLAAADIAEQVAKQVSKKLGEVTAESGLMPELPEAFYGSRFEPSRELPLPDSPKLRRVYSGPRLMVHNETLWTLPLDGKDPLKVLQPLLDELTAGGWRASVKLSEKDPAPYFRLSRGPDVVEAYVPQERWRDGDEKPQRIVIMLRERFSRDETSAAVQELFDAGASLSQLSMFMRHMNEPQRKAMVERVIDEGSTDAELLLSVAQYHEKQGQREAALETLNRAALLAASRGNASSVRKRIEEAGRKITGDEKWEPVKPDEAMLRAAGFNLLPEAGEVTAEVGLSEPANFYAAGEDLMYHSIIVEPSAIPQGVFTLVHRTGEIGSGGGSSTNATVHNPSRPWRSGTSFHADGKAVQVDAVEIGDERFRITVKREAR